MISLILSLSFVSDFIISSIDDNTDREAQKPSVVSNSAIEQLTDSYQLLFRSINEHMNDSQSKSFAEQLLRITTEYLHKVSRNIVAQLQSAGDSERDISSNSGEAVKSLCAILRIINGYIGELHHLIITKRPFKPAAKSPNSKDDVDLVLLDNKPNYPRWRQMKLQVSSEDFIL